MFKKVDVKQSFSKMEEGVLRFWEEEKIFEQTLEKTKKGKPYTFYDGPPFATGNPHYGHLVGSIMKDVIPRYWTMRGRYVERKWGWDCHGLPIETLVEKELGFKHKKDIEEYGVEKFNESCRQNVLGYVDEWKKVISRLGRWADMENSYKTMDLSYMESVWWVFKELWDKGLIYEGYRSMHVCTRCETTLSQQEVSEGYMDIKDLSVIAKFELLDDVETFVLAWTTTPWTLIGNVALAVGGDIQYVKVRFQGSMYILAKNRLAEIFKEKEFEMVSEFQGSELVGRHYKPLFDYYQSENLENFENGWKIYATDFVTTDDGVGVVHIAPAFGEDDMNLGREKNLPFIQHVKMDGTIKEEAVDFFGMNVKPIDDHMKTDVEIIKFLAKKGTLFAKEKYEHSYPHCWRCDTPLINYATTSWFVSVSVIKEKALQNAENINWFPQHIKYGRFGKWLEGARDWSISRQRFWASVMPIWKCECGERKVFGSVKDLEEESGQKISDLHKHVVDTITIPCNVCKKQMRRIPDVLDTWFDSGSMPYAQMHYPFENKEKFEAGFPAEFIAEGVDQTRAWFYYQHIIATGIKDTNAFNNVIVNGIVLAEDGKKMSKRLKNYPDPMTMFNKYSADAIRLYLMSSPVVAADNLNFKESDVADLVRGMFRMFWNSYSFFVLYADIDGFDPNKKKEISGNLLDTWILSELHILIRDVNENMEKYDLAKTARLFPKFMDNLSNWYIRRSRKRFWKSENDTDKDYAYQTLHSVLVELSKLMAPFAPFMSEEVYKNLTGEKSVHLADFPVANEALIDESLNRNMADMREIISLGLQERAKAKIKVRQPLSAVILGKKFADTFKALLSGDIAFWNSILEEELNVKSATFDEKIEIIALNEIISEELRLEGIAREIIRFIQEMRKEAGFDVDNHITINYLGESKVFQAVNLKELIAKETLAEDIIMGEGATINLKKTFMDQGEEIELAITKK
jgi:isoleucyl-tRNA synthetase